MIEIKHPLPLNTLVSGKKPPCSCKGPDAPWDMFTGRVLKVITNHTGVWYYISSNATVKSEWCEDAIMPGGV